MINPQWGFNPIIIRMLFVVTLFQQEIEEPSLFSVTTTWESFRDAIKEQYYPVGSYDDLYTKWTTLRQERDQAVPDFKNIFHTLRTELGIKDSKRHLVLKYRGVLHRYIQTKMEFLDISSLGAAYRYVIKIEQKLKQKTRQFGPRNPSQKNPGKGGPNPQNKGQRKYGQYQDNQSKPQERRTLKRQRKISGSGATSIRSLGIKLLIVAQSRCCWPK
jgi:hypothetical protein